jgi:Cu-Zn family superoxide dismutase
MKRLKLFLGLTCAFALVLAQYATAQHPEPTGAAGAAAHHQGPVVGIGTTAKATLQGNDAKLTGSFTFTQTAAGVHIVGDVTGATPGKHGLHIHAKGVCAAPFTSVGPTLDPYSVPHGCPPNNIRQLGDLGNLEVKSDGTGHFDQVIDKISVTDPHHLIVGKAITLQSTEDDCKTAPAGKADTAAACGVITK